MAGVVVRVDMNYGDIRHGVLMGTNRNIHHRFLGTKPKYGQSAMDTWRDDIVGALGEVAVAKHLGLYPDFENRPGYLGDVGRFEVRSTQWSRGSLIVYENDPDDRLYILVCGMPAGAEPFLVIPGALPAAEAKQPRYWRTDIRWPAFVIPWSGLRPLESFITENANGHS